jgi:hypothetical protein
MMTPDKRNAGVDSAPWDGAPRAVGQARLKARMEAARRAPPILPLVSDEEFRNDAIEARDEYRGSTGDAWSSSTPWATKGHPTSYEDDGPAIPSWAHIFALNFISYLALVYNFRVVAMGLYIPAVLSDCVVAWLSITILQRIASTPKSRADVWAYCISGGIASAVGIWITRQMFGH